MRDDLIPTTREGALALRVNVGEALADPRRFEHPLGELLKHIVTEVALTGCLSAEMAAVYSGNIIWGEDLMTIPVSGPGPAAHVG